MDPETIEEIEKYLDQELDAKGKKEFEERLKTDQNLADRVDFMQKLRKNFALQQYLNQEQAELLPLTNELGEQYFDQKGLTDSDPPTVPIPLIPMRKWGRISAAAIILIIGGVCLYWYMNRDLYTKDHLIAGFYEPVLRNPRSGIKKSLTELTQDDPEYLQAVAEAADQSLNQQQFSSSQQMLEMLLRMDSTNTRKSDNINLEAAKWNLLVLGLLNLEPDSLLNQLMILQNGDASLKYQQGAERLRKKMKHPFYRWAN